MAAPALKPSKRNVAELPPSIGDVAKTKYDGFLASIIRPFKNAAKQALDSNFGKGVLLTAVAVIAVMAIVPGWMSTMGTMTTNGISHAPLARVMGEGVEHALAFLSPFDLQHNSYNMAGIATLLGGGLVGRYVLPKVFGQTETLSVSQAKQKAEEITAARAQEAQPALTPDMGKEKTAQLDEPVSSYFQEQLALQRRQATMEQGR